MAAISSGVADPAVSSITDTRYCIGSSPMVFGRAPSWRPLTPATNTTAPIRHGLPRLLSRTSGRAGQAGPTWRMRLANVHGARSAGVQDEEQEAQETAPLSLIVVGKELAGSIRRGRGLADGRYPEARGGEGVGHRVQRPVPKTHQRGLAARGPLGGQVGGREVVCLVARIAVHQRNGKGMVDGHDEPSAGLEHAPQFG